MAENKNKKILIIEDAKGTAKGYEELLCKAGYDDITICHTGTEVQSLIDRGQEFDLSIVDIVLPSEDPNRYALAECLDTGVRLIRQMAEKDICHRFYVITVRSSLKSSIERLCKERKAVLKFEAKIDHEPEKLADNVADLLGKSVDSGEKTLLSDLKDHADIIRTYAKSVKCLSNADKQQLMASMKSIRMILAKSGSPNFEQPSKEILSFLRKDYQPNTEGALKKETERTIDAIQEWLKKYGKRT
jgi:CheY-like chemotaxis protein